MVSQQAAEYVRDLVRKRSAISIDSSKDYLIEMRLMPLATEHGCAGIDALVSRARGGEQVLNTKIVEALATHETSFFRDSHPFQVLEHQVLPRLAASRGKLTIWSAACSSGQEIYSLAMLVLEHFPQLARGIRFIATDLSEQVLAKASAGRFSQLEVNRGLPVALLLKYFDRAGTSYVIKDEVRRMIEFKPLNLISIPPGLRADIVFMRNVLIYFDVEAKRTILDNVRQILAPDGALFLGAAETTLNVSTGWEPVMVGPATYYRIKR